MTIPQRELHLELPTDLAYDYQELVDVTSLSRGEIFRRALTLYTKSVRTCKQGGNVILRDSDGSLREITGIC